MFQRQMICFFALCKLFGTELCFFFSTSKKTIVFYLMEVNILFKKILLEDFYWIFVLVVC